MFTKELISILIFSIITMCLNVRSIINFRDNNVNIKYLVFTFVVSIVYIAYFILKVFGL